MARARTYPKANTTSQWWEDKFARTTMPTIDKLLLHTTETGKSWPGYEAGGNAPTITYNPWMQSLSNRWRQHNYLDRSARALRDPDSTPVRENRDRVVQVEIICYCDPKLAKQYGYFVGDLPDHAYEDLGDFLAFLNREWGTPIVRAPEWETFPPADRIRMSSSEYDQFKGVLGHQHASGNTHGDPGMTNAQVDRILAVAKRLAGGSTGTTPTPKPPAQEGDLTVSQYDDIMAKLDKIDRDATNRYNDLANRVQAVLKEERARYGDYVGRFDSILATAAAEDKLDDAAVAELRSVLGEVKTAVEALPTEPAPNA